MRKGYLQGEPVRTIYLGGGTPSRLREEDLHTIFETIELVYGLEAAEEITLEANPDDLTEAYVATLRRLPVNRISMGIQTFHNPTLQLLNRRHTAEEACRAVERLRRSGFQNISIDLIYGLPGETPERWAEDLRRAIDLHVEHISAYHLTYEEGTPLYNMLGRQEITEVDEDLSLQFFSSLTDTLREAGYEHYEISNFCLPGKHARHNTSYWEGVPYLGCGPSAHSFDRQSRQWNVSDLEAYITALEQDRRFYDTEWLDTDTRYNEYLMTGLRTRRGISIDRLFRDFGTKKKDYCLRMATPYLKSGYLEQNDDTLRLTRKGIFLSDGIISSLMWV